MNKKPKQTRVLVTGVGGPAAIAFIRAVAAARPELEIHGGDMDPLASGLHLLPEHRRHLLPAGRSSELVPRLLEICRDNAIDVLVPTVDVELLPVASARSRFSALGVQVLISRADGLGRCLDKWSLYLSCKDHVRVPRTAIFDDALDVSDWAMPVVIKPRRGSGSRGIYIIHSPEDLARVPRSEDTLIQAHLPGEEYSVDVLAEEDGRVLAAVPRERMKTDSGIAVTSRTVRDDALCDLATRVVEALGLAYVSNVQVRRDASGRPALLEINPRFPGTMPLTIAAGVDMPILALEILERGTTSTPVEDFVELAMVRTWQEHFMPVDALGRTTVAMKRAS